MLSKSAIRLFLNLWTRSGPNLPLPSADEQTRLSWARLAASYAEVPEAYRPFFDSLPPGKADPFPYTVITPTFRGFLSPEKEKLICRIDQTLHVLETADTRLREIRYPLDGIHRIETGSILLHAWLTINGIDADGKAAATTVRFNSVTEHLLAPFVEGFRAAVAGPSAGTEPDLSAFDPLEETHFKFMNYGRKTARPGERVIQILVQPELRRTYFRLPGFTVSRRIAPAHMAIVTDSELIIVRDDPRQGDRPHPYGGIWNYIPLKKISRVTLLPAEDDSFLLSILLPQNFRIGLPYQSSLHREATKLTQNIKTEAAG
jgi:hypothetical protein